MNSPVISVVIPTRGRPQLLRRSLDSALGQTVKAVEVIVVIDGPDDATESMLAEYSDPRLRVIALPESSGGAGARNAGVGAATSPWVAFLDDDDEWLPEKLEKQLAQAQRSSVANPIVSCLSFVHTPTGEYHWPTRVPRADEPIGDYLFVRRSLFQGEGFVGTPTILTTRRLMLEVPFSPALKRHQDWDWLLRACSRDDVALEYVPERLVRLYMEERRPGISSGKNWRNSLQWGRTARAYLTPHAYAGFLLLVVSSIASRERAWSAFPTILREAFSAGAPSPRLTAIFLAMWFVPETARRQLRRYLSHARQA